MEKPNVGQRLIPDEQRIISIYFGTDAALSPVANGTGLPEIQRFGKDTLMPMPEKSYFQELLDQPAPLENRIAHLIAYVDVDPLPEGEINSEYFIAKQIGSTPKWVNRKAQEISLVSSNSEFDQNNEMVDVYDSPALELLREEWRWHNETCDLDDYIKLSEFARLLGKPEDWAIKYAHELGVSVRYVLAPSGRKTRFLPRILLHQLRHIILTFPPQGDWYTEFELKKETGHDGRWLVSQLGRVGITTSLRWSDLTGKLLKFFPPESPDAVQNIESNLPKHAGNWLTGPEIARKIGMGEEWTNTRLREMVDPIAEDRLNVGNIIKLHYSPETIARVEQKAIEVMGIPEVGDWYNVSQLARGLVVNEPWVRRRLPFLGSTPEPRRDSVGHIRMHYPPEALEELRQMQGINLSDLRF